MPLNNRGVLRISITAMSYEETESSKSVTKQNGCVSCRVTSNLQKSIWKYIGNGYEKN